MKDTPLPQLKRKRFERVCNQSNKKVTVKGRNIKIIKEKDVDARASVRAATEVAVADAQAEIRRRRRTGNSVVSAWISERRETESRSRSALLKRIALNLSPEDT